MRTILKGFIKNLKNLIFLQHLFYYGQAIGSDDNHVQEHVMIYVVFSFLYGSIWTINFGYSCWSWVVEWFAFMLIGIN